MNDNLDIKNLEKKAWQSTFRDGFWDIYIGMLIMGMGLTWIGRLLGLPETLDVLIVIISWDIGAMIIMFLGKRFITMPRIGFVKFGKIRKKRNKKLSIFLGITVIATIITFILTLLGMFQISLPGFLVMLIIGLLFITIPFSTLAFFLQFKRLYFYSIIGGLGLFFAELLFPVVGSPINDFIIFGTIGGIITISGIIILLKFIQKNPKSKKEDL